MTGYAIGDLPTISAGAHTHAMYSPDNFAKPVFGRNSATSFGLGNARTDSSDAFIFATAKPAKNFHRVEEIVNAIQSQSVEETDVPTSFRLVQVYIADPDDRIPLEKRLLYKGEPKLTDLTDQELFFEVEIKNLLDGHNAERVKIRDKAVKDREEFLEPVKIRDLKMVVVSLVAF